MIVRYAPLLSWILFVLYAEAETNCSKEFSTCSTNRDCCEGTRCVMGDWSVTTDSVCLSTRSERLNQMEKAQKIALIKEYYSNFVKNGKSPEDVEKLATKYDDQREFAQLVARLEHKYGHGIDEARTLDRSKQEL